MDFLDAIGEMADEALPVDIPAVRLAVGAGNKLDAVREIGEQLLEVSEGSRIAVALRLPGCRLDFEAELPLGMLAHRVDDEPRCPWRIVPLDPAVEAVHEGRLLLGLCRQRQKQKTKSDGFHWQAHHFFLGFIARRPTRRGCCAHAAFRTPTPPHAAEYLREVFGEPLAVAERRGGHPLAQARPATPPAAAGRRPAKPRSPRIRPGRGRPSPSGRRWTRWLSECRLANVSPGQVTTGTPIHSASQVVTPPPNGNGSSATSICR